MCIGNPECDGQSEGRSDVETTLLRAPGQLYQREANGLVSDLYTIELVNKTYRSMPVRFRINRPDAIIRMVQPLTEVPGSAMAKGVFFILLPEKSIQESSTKLELKVFSGNKIIERSITTFLGLVN